ncbi:MAG: hypothetical protein KFB97_11240 [Cyanobium sp. M30B3]|nr:MAG: hypothetical protein KFB97_11240 [Cyanobium sp. M30B3]
MLQTAACAFRFDAREMKELIKAGAEREARGRKQEHGGTMLSKGLTLGVGIVGEAAVISRAEHQQHGSALQQQMAESQG